jgi:nickel transport protein
VRSCARTLGVIAALLAATPAAAHETLHEVQRGKAIAVKAFVADGEALADTAYEVYSPVDPQIPYQKGRTDRSGWLAFVPDAPGKWRVKVIDDTGHGLDVQIDAEAHGASPATQASTTGAVSSAGFVLRPLLGLVAIGAVFAALFFAHRRKRSTP